MNKWGVNEEKYFIEVYDTKDSEEYSEIEIEDAAYVFIIAEELLYVGKTIKIRKETYYV